MIAALNCAPSGRPDPQKTRWWNVLVASAGRSLAIAHFFVDNQLQLQFQWLAAASTVASQLRNAVLMLRSGPHQHSIALRRPVYQDGITLAFNRRELVFPVSLQARPRQDMIFLEVTKINNVSVPVSFVPDNRTVPLDGKERQRIQVGESKLVELDIQIRQNSRDDLELAIRPVYLRQGRNNRISRPSLTKMFSRELRRNQINFVEGWNKYLAALNRKPVLLAEIQVVRGKLVAAEEAVKRAPTNIGAQRQANLLRGRLNTLLGDLKKCNGTIERWREQLPESSAALGRQRQIEVLGHLLHEVAHLELRILARGQSGDIPLWVASSEPPPVPPEIKKISEEFNPAGVWVDGSRGDIYELAGGGPGGDGVYRILPPNFDQSRVKDQGTWRVNEDTVTLTSPAAIATYKGNENFELKSTTTSLFRIFGVTPSAF